MPDGELSEISFEENKGLVRRIFPFVVSAEDGGLEGISPSAERNDLRFPVHSKSQPAEVIFDFDPVPRPVSHGKRSRKLEVPQILLPQQA